MEESPIRLLIADDNRETCDILVNFFALTPEINVCGVAYDGEEALFRTAQLQPDVLLLDLIMPKADGLAVLERLGKAPLEKRPRVIVTSAVGQESFTTAALALGANYYMIKPYSLTDLLGRVCTVATAPASGPTQAMSPRPEDSEHLISRALMDLGIPVHMLGYRYGAAAVDMLLREKGRQSIVKDIYAEVARVFITTPECVEGAIRKAIRRAWDSSPEPFRQLIGGSDDTPPANGRLLTALAQHIKLG